ncbi:hypothetical protein DPMN_099919 [Dreissena polymorpha]|uniref:Uncharacterized protein n=1 Tax=Dreissena polymorpha TaxID=45954 RepID=A0A9D4LGI9_DREPO|nr:hypothetical protein DPMN_099919 [Dreissena polymorpha]
MSLKEGERLQRGDEATVCNDVCANPIIAKSVVSDNEALPAIKFGNEAIPELLNWIEEADARVVAHFEWAARIKQCQRVVVMSNDADSFALLLNFTPYFQTLGMKEIWQQYGTGEKRRMLSLHQAISRLGTPLANTMINAHILTGDDCMSKVGPKHAAVTSDPGSWVRSSHAALIYFMGASSGKTAKL